MRVPMRMSQVSCCCLSLCMHDLACMARAFLAVVVLVCACRRREHSVRIASDAAQTAGCMTHSSAVWLPCRYMVHLWHSGLRPDSMSELND